MFNEPAASYGCSPTQLLFTCYCTIGHGNLPCSAGRSSTHAPLPFLDGCVFASSCQCIIHVGRHVVRLCVCAGARDGGEGAERGETPCPSKLCCVMGVMSLSFLLLSRLWNTHLRLPVETAVLFFLVFALRPSPCIMFHKQLPMCTRSAASGNVFLQLVLLTAAVIQIDFVDRGPFAAIVDCLYTTTPFSAPCS